MTAASIGGGRSNQEKGPWITPGLQQAKKHENKQLKLKAKDHGDKQFKLKISSMLGIDF